ncbi:helix-turn-helix domain-containing protein [Vogesella indigofera]|uniref:helix-turn-helix domain-containing protein n=1 Tax=Vogesella indigofera TaxID=45465 RepID=UPI0014759310|nr:helix-turn-helix transcriptional regulator [Vogesella indigofera]
MLTTSFLTSLTCISSIGHSIQTLKRVVNAVFYVNLNLNYYLSIDSAYFNPLSVVCWRLSTFAWMRMTANRKVAQYGAVLMYLLVVERKNKGGDVNRGGFSQGEVAEAAGLSQSTWARMEKGEGAVQLDYIATVAPMFGHSILDMVKAADVLCSVLEDEGLPVRGYGYKDYRHLSANMEVATVDEIQDAYTRAELGRAFVLFSAKFGGIVSTLLTYEKNPEAFRSLMRQNREQLSVVTKAGFTV